MPDLGIGEALAGSALGLGDILGGLFGAAPAAAGALGADALAPVVAEAGTELIELLNDFQPLLCCS